MNDIDTAEIRDEYGVIDEDKGLLGLIRDLCNALDATRAELERERVMHRGLDPEKARYRRWWKQEKARAEAAEAERDNVKGWAYGKGGWSDAYKNMADRAEIAEARIAAARQQMCGKHRGEWYCCCDDIDNALGRGAE